MSSSDKANTAEASTLTSLAASIDFNLAAATHESLSPQSTLIGPVIVPPAENDS